METKGFFQFEIINVLAVSPSFEDVCWGSAAVYRHQILMYKDSPRTESWVSASTRHFTKC